MEKWNENWYEGRKRWKTMPKWLQQELPDIKKSTAAAWIYRRYDISLRDFLKITLSGIGLLLITADIFYHNLLAAAVLCPYLHFRLKIKSEELHKQRRERLKMQFKDGMQSVAFSLNSGYSIENAWKEAIVYMGKTVKSLRNSKELSIVWREMKISKMF